MIVLYRKIKIWFENKFPRIFKKANKRKRIIKYLIAGGTATVTHICLLYVFTDIFGLWYITSTSIAFIFSFMVSFTLQKFWTFRDNNREEIKKQALKYFFVTSVSLAINGFIMYVFVDWLNIMYLLAQIITSGTIAFGNFMVYKFFIFNKSDEN